MLLCLSFISDCIDDKRSVLYVLVGILVHVCLYELCMGIYKYYCTCVWSECVHIKCFSSANMLIMNKQIKVHCQ